MQRQRHNTYWLRAWGERGIALLLLLCGLLSVATTVAIVGILAFESLVFFREVSIVSFLTDTEWTPLFINQHFGILPLLMGTLMTSVIAVGVSVPLGLLAAIYLSEFASERARRWLKPTLELLSGIPTVVFGYFALNLVTPVLQKIIPGLSGFNALAPGIVMGVMIMPIICSLSEDAFSAVPRHLREAAYGLGARKLPTIFGVLIPSAYSGLAAAVTLGLGRAIGETMIVTIAAGQRPVFTLDPRVPIETMTAYIVQVSMGDVPAGSLTHRTIFVVGGALFLMTFAVNYLSKRLAEKVRRV